MVTRPRRICLGLHVADGSRDLTATLTRLHESIAQCFDLVLLVDTGAAELATLGRVPQITIPPPGGAAASFNALLTQPADIYLLLESGVRPGPGWLSHLLDALDGDAANGIAGPSTNLCWNEQAVARHCGASPQDIEHQAKVLADAHANTWRVMTPLYNLSDFCLAVRREVVEEIGGADTDYGRGPCWEMDYAVRAARAGFKSVWSKAAFVHRMPISDARRHTEAGLIEASKRLYQDRFCGRRQGATTAPYHAHCRGEACADFAPAATTRLRLSLPKPTPGTSKSAEPLISCVMPTRRRPCDVAQSIQYFLRQDYPNRELIIVYTDENDLPGMIDAPMVRTLHSAQTTIGGKREDGTRASNGEIIVHWDDDDWYSPERLRLQAEPIIRGLADITGLNDFLFMTVPAGDFWSVSRALFARMFAENVAGGTLMFRREVWQHSGPYPAISLREDAMFLAASLRGGARLCRLSAREHYIYVRHDHNTWRFHEGSFLQPSGWSREVEPDFLAPDRGFYFPAAPAVARRERMVSCIMPTANRQAFIPRAIRQFLAQDYPARELIVIDDGQDSIADLVPQMDSIRYLRLEQHVPIGAKRNIGCDMARGEIIAHWDDDDWMAPQWLRSQVETLSKEGADICGLDKVFFYAPETRQAWRYVYGGAQTWVCGGTLCFTKDLWRQTGFQEIDIGEDNAFVWSLHPKHIAISTHAEFYVATVHRANTSPKITTGTYWHCIAPAYLERLMHENNSVNALARDVLF